MERRSLQVQILLVTLLFNGLLLGALYYLFPTVGTDPVLFFGVGILGTLLLYVSLNRLVASQPVISEPRETQPSQPSLPPSPDPVSVPEPPAPAPKGPGPDVGAVQMLAILQRKGRLIDFLQEDISSFQDAQIGAAVRTIHAGCREALAEHVDLAPVYAESEGSQVTIEPGFDPEQVRLSGAVQGDPPFQGTLQHRGWKIASLKLPRRVDDGDESRIVAPAEVEV